MHQVAPPSMTRLLVGASALVIAAATLVLGLPGDARAGAGNERLAKRLLQRDPGAAVGGKTQVATAAGAVLRGKPGRINFMMALGDRQRLFGSDVHDELGAFHGTDGVRIHGRGGDDLIHGMRGDQLLDGGRGDDGIYGGGGDDRIIGGPGDDLIIDKQGRSIVVTGSGRDRVDVADGDPGDGVLCSPGAIDRVAADPGDELHPRCRRAAAGRASAEASQAVTGSGSNDDPYVSDCADPNADKCVLTTFDERRLSDMWSHEYVPAYQCNVHTQPTHPYLLNQNYAPAGTTLPKGVEVIGLGPISVSITGIAPGSNIGLLYGIGTLTGGLNSSATSWSFSSNTYRVQLHCSRNLTDGYLLP
jgi:RTX calcium-binding nonapeptide repeat (4 copies)